MLGQYGFLGHFWEAPRHPRGMQTRRTDEPAISGTGVDKFFFLAIVAKALFGLAEVVAGLVLLAVGAARLDRLAVWLETTAPSGLTSVAAQHLLTFISHTGTVADALLLIGHGAIKLFLIIGILRNKLWAYLWMIVAMVIFVVTEVAQGALTGQAGMYAIAVLDVIVLVLTVIEWHRHRRGRGLWVGATRHVVADRAAATDAPVELGAGR